MTLNVSMNNRGYIW